MYFLFLRENALSDINKKETYNKSALKQEEEEEKSMRAIN